MAISSKPTSGAFVGVKRISRQMRQRTALNVYWEYRSSQFTASLSPSPDFSDGTWALTRPP